MADIVLPATTGLERDDIGYARREPYLIAMKKAREPIGEARDDYWIFSEITRRLGADDVYTEGRDTMQWLAHMHEEGRQKSAKVGVPFPSFEEFWEAGIAEAKGENREPVMLAKFRADPAANPLKTPSGKIEIFSEKIASFGYDDCPGHATWLEPIEWLGSKKAERYPLHMLSDQPTDKLHSQLDHSPHAKATKVKGRQPVTMHPEDAAARGIADGDMLRVFNDRGACLAAAQLSDRIRRGVVRLSTGAWFDPEDSGLQPAAGEARQPQCAHPRHRRLEAEPGLHRPDLPGRDRTLRRSGAGGHRPHAAGLRRALGRAGDICASRRMRRWISPIA